MTRYDTNSAALILGALALAAATASSAHAAKPLTLPAAEAAAAKKVAPATYQDASCFHHKPRGARSARNHAICVFVLDSPPDQACLSFVSVRQTRKGPRAKPIRENVCTSRTAHDPAFAEG
jgi:hypothetical protein